MAVPGSGTAPLNNPDHRAEHDRIIPSLDKGPRGIVAYQIGTAVNVPVGAGWTALYGLYNTQLFAGRLYLLGFSIRALAFGAAGSFWFTTNSQTALPRCSLILDCWCYNVAGAAYDNFSWEQPFIVDMDMTIPTIQVTATAPAGSAAWLEYGGHMRIEDIGSDQVGRIW